MLDIEKIVTEYLNCNRYMSIRHLARKYKMSKSTICNLINKHCPENLRPLYKEKAKRQMTVYLEKISDITTHTAEELLGY